ncbi:hypothetical protein cyc_01407 [Cyclospora cayetanensis]|uniref:Uncharacterized protein n=1 Tax=Cyclospora cayetanensis TaxID=88456 RepID=A0A1D3D8P5_9EIME|nr:hypothetical protein cyc_01407 [Cyclospora cayetanensis]
MYSSSLLDCTPRLLHPLSQFRSRASSLLPPSSLASASYHHSAALQRYFTNRYHKKICPKCTRPNILPSPVCVFCRKELTDLDIHPIGRDALRDLVVSRQVNHDQTATLLSKAEKRQKAEGGNREEGRVWKSGRVVPLQRALGDLPRPLGVTASFEECPSQGFTELFRSFHFVILTYPFPSSFIHLIAAPKASIYDIRQLRRAHLPLLLSMREKVAALARSLLDIAVLPASGSLPKPSTAHRGCSPGAGKAPVACVASGDSKKGETMERELIGSDRRRAELHQSMILGFNYPAEYGQLCLHALVPPFYEQGIFQPPFFYPFNKVTKDLETSRSVQVVAPHTLLSMQEDPVLETVKQRDAMARQLLGVATHAEADMLKNSFYCAE